MAHSKSVSWHQSSDRGSGPGNSSKGSRYDLWTPIPIQEASSPQSHPHIFHNLPNGHEDAPLDNVTGPLFPVNAKPPSDPDHAHRRRLLRHKPSLSTDSLPLSSHSTDPRSHHHHDHHHTISSPIKRGRHHRSLISPAPIVFDQSADPFQSYSSPFDFQFPPHQRSTSGQSIRSTGRQVSEAGLSDWSQPSSRSSTASYDVMSPLTDDSGPLPSPYILSYPQPNLQDVFIALANKERQVLEARELLNTVEAELTQFKEKWKSILTAPEVPIPKSHDDFDDYDNAQYSKPNRRSSLLYEQPPSIYSTLGGNSGLGINGLCPENNGSDDTIQSQDEDVIYEELCKRLNEIDGAQSNSQVEQSNTTKVHDGTAVASCEFNQLADTSLLGSLLGQLKTLLSLLFVRNGLRYILGIAPAPVERNVVGKVNRPRRRYPSVNRTYYSTAVRTCSSSSVGTGANP